MSYWLDLFTYPAMSIVLNSIYVKEMVYVYEVETSQMDISKKELLMIVSGIRVMIVAREHCLPDGRLGNWLS